MKRADHKYFIAFLVFLSALNPACNHPKQDTHSIYQQYVQHHLIKARIK